MVWPGKLSLRLPENSPELPQNILANAWVGKKSTILALIIGLGLGGGFR